MRRLALFFGLLAVMLAPVIYNASPAFAVTGHLEMWSSPHYCVGGTLSAGSQAITVTCPGRTIDFAPGPGGTGVLRSTTSGLCLSPISDNNLIIEWGSCSRTGVSWSWVTSTNSHYFVNTHQGNRLSADNARGDPLVDCPPGGCSGNFTYQQWIGPTG